MPIPSGLLNGRGCKDSICRSDNDSGLFMSIRHQSMTFLVEEREAKAKLNLDDSDDQNTIDARVREQFTSGTLPVLRSIAKFFSLIFVFPFHFLFKQLPELIAISIVNPLVALAKKLYERVAPPCKKVFYSIYNPIVAVCRKIKEVVIRVITAIKGPCLRLQRQTLVILQKVYVTVVLPPRNLIHKFCNFISGCCQQLGYRLQIAKIWIKLLIDHSLSCVPTIVGKKK